MFSRETSTYVDAGLFQKPRSRIGTIDVRSQAQGWVCGLSLRVRNCVRDKKKNCLITGRGGNGINRFSEPVYGVRVCCSWKGTLECNEMIRAWEGHVYISRGERSSVSNRSPLPGGLVFAKQRRTSACGSLGGGPIIIIGKKSGEDPGMANCPCVTARG